MSDLCGFIGKTEENVLYSMVNTAKSDECFLPEYYHDGEVHLGYIPYEEWECDGITHNATFTVWVMVNAGTWTDEFNPAAVVKAYEAEGVASFRKWEGCFSIVLWDGIKKRLYLVRDRYGAKPLYRALTKDGLVFGNKIKTVLQHKDVSKTVNDEALYQYMSYQSVYLPHTAYQDVFQIPQATYGVFFDGKYEEFSYDTLPCGKESADSYGVAADKVYSMLDASVKMHCTKQEMGIFLSGGLDSSLIASIAKDSSLKYAFCLKPITKMGSRHQKETDVQYSEELAKEYGLEHYVWEMTPQDLINDIDEILGCFMQPFSGTMSTYYLSKKAVPVCKNILTGDGADELFGSYRHHSVLLPIEKYAKCREQGKNILENKSDFYPYDESLSFLESLYQYAGTDDTLCYYRLLQMGDGEKGIFLNPERFDKYIEKQSTLQEIVRWDKMLISKGVLNRSLERDFYHLMPGHTLLYQEALAGNFGIHLKMPFLDRNLTDYVVTLPQEYKIRSGCTKAVLKEAAVKVLPEKIVFRKKEPFSLPITEWLKTDLKEYLTDVLSEDSIKRNGILNPICVQYALSEFYKYPTAKEYYGQMLWTMAMLERWAGLYT